MVTNEISFSRILQTVYALSALGSLTGNPDLPRPLGLDEEEALLELARRHFCELCAELGATAADTTVTLPADVHTHLEQVVTDRLLATLCSRQASPALLAALRSRLRPIPAPGGRY